MPRKKKEPEKTESSLKQETKHWMLSILFFVVAIFLALASFQKAGVVGTTIFGWFDTLFGVGYTLLPFISIILGISFFRNKRVSFAFMSSLGGTLLLLSGLGLVALLSGEGSAGVIGSLVTKPMLALFDFWISLVLLFAIFLVSFAVIFDTKPTWEFFCFWKNFILRKKKEGEEEDEEEYYEDEDEGEGEGEEEGEEEEEENEDGDEEEEEEEPEKAKKEGALSINTFLGKKGEKEEKEVHGMMQTSYTPPPLSLLSKDNGKPSVGDIKANANIIRRTLQNFGIDVEMDEISIGPSFTRYALKPAEGVKLSRIIGLQNDLSLALAAHPIRIEAPIPGKSLVGIEIPNSTKMTVGLGSLLASADFSDTSMPLLLALGKSISGDTHFSNLSKMPHLLIAGSTGSGKSVAIHTIINSLLFKNSPEHMRFLLIDPKRVELTLYKNIPHLLTPVITDSKKAILALKWAAKEMDRRYDILEAESVRDIASYHKNIVTPAHEAYKERVKGSKKNGDEQDMSDTEVSLPEKMPYIVIIIDELADIMSAYPRELESAIVRLAQMSRAVGIHLVLSTQRPSVNVITGLIKANIPSRIAMQVSSQIDSRTILDQSGAEKLLGAGDMLYMSGEMSKPVRLQSAFISEKEVKDVAKYLRKEYQDELPDEITLTDTSSRDILFESNFDSEEDEDELYEEARETVIAAGKASSSYLQRKLKVGYARAARLLDMLEERGVVGPADGSKPREIREEAMGENDDEVYGDEEK